MTIIAPPFWRIIAFPADARYLGTLFSAAGGQLHPDTSGQERMAETLVAASMQVMVLS